MVGAVGAGRLLDLDHGHEAVRPGIEAGLVHLPHQWPDLVGLALDGRAQGPHLVLQPRALYDGDGGVDVPVGVVRCAGGTRQALQLHDHARPPCAAGGARSVRGEGGWVRPRPGSALLCRVRARQARFRLALVRLAGGGCRCSCLHAASLRSHYRDQVPGVVLSDLSLSAPPAANSITEYACSTLGGAVPGVNRPSSPRAA